MMLRLAVALSAALAAAACATSPAPPLLAAPAEVSPPFLRTYTPPGNAAHTGVLIVPGCSAPLLSSRAALFERYARKLVKEGFSAAIMNYAGGTPCPAPARIAEAIGAALVDMQSRKEFDAGRFHIAGWSEGAAGVLEFIKRPARPRGLVSAIAFYPACPPPDAWQSEVTLLMLLGEKDETAPPEACRTWADESDGPGPVAITRYVSAGHGFDVGEAGDTAYAAYQTPAMTLHFDASTSHQSWLDLLSFLRLDLKPGI